MNAARSNALAEIICRIPESFFLTLDHDGSYRIFASAAKEYLDAGRQEYDRALALIGIAAGLANYQQLDPMKTYWEPLGLLLRRENLPDSIDNIRRVTVELARGSRLGGQKARRVERMFESGFATWFWADLNLMRREPYGAWLRLAGSLNDPPDKKTIVMAMKAFDMETLAVTGGYLRFPPDVPIMVDSRVAKITRSSGLVEDFPSISDDDIASRYRRLIIEAWATVVRAARETTGEWFSALRLDTLIWWIGEIPTRSSAAAYLVSKGLDQRLADRISRELFFIS